LEGEGTKLDQNISIVLVALIAIIVPVLNWWQNRGIARHVAAKVTERGDEATKLLAANTEQQNIKLDEIHVLVNSRLSEALETIEELKALLLLALSAAISPEDPRIQDAIAKQS
jgi:hypothetical protein